MIISRSSLFLIIFGLMAVQMFFSFIQVKRYQNAVREMMGKAILGIGHRKGVIKSGEILLLAYNREKDRVVRCRSMRGLTIFASFKDRPEFAGMSLNDARLAGLKLDAREMGCYRRRHPYDPNTLSKKKGALIQAVEAIELCLKRQKAEESEDAS